MGRAPTVADTPKTGAAQLVEIRETVQEIVVPTYVTAPQPSLPTSALEEPLFATISTDDLLGYGVPTEWLADVQHATEDTLLVLADHLPAEPAEALLELATGGKPRAAQPATPTAGPFDHSDAQRRFRVVSDVEELASRDVIREIVRDAASLSPDQKFSPHFLLSEWEEVVDAWQITSWDAYRDVPRLGRKTRLPEKARHALWPIFECVRATLGARGLMTSADLYSRLASHIAATGKAPYDFVVIDEAQDLSVAQLRFVAALGAARPDSLFFAGDLGQRIFQTPFSWKSLGVDIRGRSGTLRINYRTSHQIRAQADLLLGTELADVDGNSEDRRGTISVFNGPRPSTRVENTAEEEIAAVSHWLTSCASGGVQPEEMGIFVRSAAELPRARAAAQMAGLQFTVLDDHMEPARNTVSIGTMHLSKGLEFRAVVVMACDDDILPLQARIETVTDDSDLEEVYDTERHLLYVACTRARDHLLVTGVNPASEFLEDLMA